jgi:hypothetical protein
MIKNGVLIPWIAPSFEHGEFELELTLTAVRNSLLVYKKALEHFDSDVNILVCSDDIEWCKEQEFFADDRFLMNDTIEKYSHQCQEGDGQFRNSLVPYTDLCLMSLCNGAILSPSTLGWWGAWLQKSNDKKIVVPQNWFGPKLSMNDTSDLMPEEWIVLDEN